MSKKFALIIGLLVVAGCAGASLKSEWKEKRGYSDKDINAIMNQYKEYNDMMNGAKMSSNAFNSAPYHQAESRLRAVFCACAKKMGEACRKKEGASIDRSLWTKANAVDMTMIGTAMTFETNSTSVIDPAECN